MIMKIQSTNSDAIEITSVIKSKSRVAHFALSIDVQTKESPELLGLVYVEALMAGAGKLSRQQFLDTLSTIGAHLSVSYNDARITISGKCIAKHLHTHLALLSVMLSKPHFTQTEITRVKKLVKNHLIKHKENAKERALEEFRNVLFQKNDRRHYKNVDTAIQNVSTITKSDLKQLHQQILASHWILTVGGTKQDTEKITKAIQKITRKRAEASVTAQKVTPRKKRTVVLEHIPSSQNIELSIGNTLPITDNHPDLPAFLFGLFVLGKWGGFAGRLMSTVREKEGLTYGIYARTEATSTHEIGYWRIMTFFTPEKASEGIRSTLREIEKIQTHGISGDELKRFKNIFKTQQVLSNDSLEKTVTKNHMLSIRGVSKRDYDVFNERITTLKAKDVHAALKKYLQLDSLVISGAGPVRAVAKELKKYESTQSILK